MAEGERDGQVVDLTRETAVASDDITIVTHEPAPDPNRRRRVVVLASVGAVVLAGLLVALIALRPDDATSVSTGRVASTPTVPASTIATGTTSRAVAAPKQAITAAPTTAARASTAPPTLAPAVAPPAATAPGGNPGAYAPSRPAPRTTAAPAVTIKTSPLSALVWTAPASVSLPTGKKLSVAVSVRNPTAGTVTLAHPLSCTPRLQRDEVCPEMAQLVGPGQTAAATYLLDATGVAPGVYRLELEGIRPLTVTVTASLS